MSLRTTLRMTREASLEEGEPHEVAEKKRRAHEAVLRPARLEVARRTAKWTEVPNDFVERGYRGMSLVSASTDHVYERVRGIVFQPGSVNVIATHAQLYYTVDDAGELTFYERDSRTSWSEQVAARERRRH
jgi:hypothetical protein